MDIGFNISIDICIAISINIDIVVNTNNITIGKYWRILLWVGEVGGGRGLYLTFDNVQSLSDLF